MTERDYTITYQKDRYVPGLMLSWPGIFYMIDYAWIEDQILSRLPPDYDRGPLNSAFRDLHRKDLERVEDIRRASDENKWVKIPYNNNPKLEESYYPKRFCDEERDDPKA